MSETSARYVKEIAARNAIKLSAHAPYFINLNAHEPEKVRASKDRILHTARIAAACGAENLVFHAAYYLGDPPEDVYLRVRDHLRDITDQLRNDRNRILLRPEVTGKHTQFGQLEEVMRLSAEVDGVQPCIDFPHWHARTGAANSYDEFTNILDWVERRLGRQALDNMHIHLSGISHGKAGETKHLMLEESDFAYEQLMQALKDRNAKGTVISESPAPERDALLLQRLYHMI